ncbi:MAG: Alpha-L-glutamate ligase, RimK family [Microgenomates group bacterium GW2011_GWC1_41_8]|uniref:Alpha-L-glutamate ligase, RimK family n=2 Tax=Candidatus Roizmaniibacteriota TaxID=1752723 RepID=A0A0G0T4G4_9BACT|nr:MAG: Alpha-L-glutamate ligase, RimK family [Candidatus Roizmanbacteria bacterium GW2011_GWB1_40_7]KKR93931.1 MAG: Alpha-L-glutamate ligase, RimK family [Candidatus Roizmanbacteria bacterium GW2011_GWA1_41_13]KKS22903.1 MAG: Alpha-L-glutamate ligase, RimK family [Microgenomates group bacterium GW2011_GWC1_41_8]OGK50126.1 MAG: hypothetical protein A3A55_00625 [Candidatus Roizmanbacteria bacterium RIFCSPLOWO2_01_FULL_40_14]
MQLIEKELVRRRIAYDWYYYKEVTVLADNFSVRKRKLSINPEDRLLLRSPWNTPYFTRNYAVIARNLAERYGTQFIFDLKAYLTCSPYFHDKFYQGLLCNRLGIQTPPIYYFSNKKRVLWDLLPFPLVLKKRVSSRSRSNYLVSSAKELEDQLKKTTLHHHILQKYIDAKRDIRINVLKGKILYGFERGMFMHSDHRLYVKGGEPIKHIPSILKEYALKITKEIGLDFAGVDFLQGKDGRYYFLEVNSSPQFNRAQDIMPKKTAQLVVDEIVTS